MKKNSMTKISQYSAFTLKVIAHRVRNLRVRFSVFLYSSSFPIKMHATNAKMQKIEPDPKKIMTDESFGGSV